VLRRQVGLHRVAARGVHQTLGFAGSARRVKDVQRIFRIKRLCWTARWRICNQLMPPAIAAFNHVYRRTSAAKDDDVIDGVAGGHCFVDGALELNLSTASIARVLRDYLVA